MDLFDAFPPDVRRALTEADFPFPPEAVRRMLNRGVPSETVATAIADANRRVAKLRGEA